MNRRAFLFAGVAAAALPAAAWARGGGIEVIYVGGWDCPYCTKWKNEYKADWLASPEFKRVTWIEIDPPRLREAYQPRYWPADLADVLEQVPRKHGTPRFLIVKGGRIVSNELGVNKWAITLDRLHKLLG
ncbi:MAG: hypothetical protein JSR90_11090 [Proteobacteria bacterium]|nr:hypothetical protein [Pseudomonadota bacterium]